MEAVERQRIIEANVATFRSRCNLWLYRRQNADSPEPSQGSYPDVVRDVDCGFHRLPMREIQNGLVMEVATAKLRLHPDLFALIDKETRVELTQHEGVNLSIPEMYVIIGDLETRLGGLVLRLRKAQSGGNL